MAPKRASVPKKSVVVAAKELPAAAAKPAEAASATIDSRVRKAFEQFDADGNGAIDGAELRPALALLGMDTNREGADKVLKRFPNLTVNKPYRSPLGPHPLGMWECELHTPAQLGKSR